MLVRTQKIYTPNEFLREITTRFTKEQFERGKMHGKYPERYDNENIGHFAPCPYYHVGYVCGKHESMLKDAKIPQEQWNDYALQAELKDPRFPLSSPAQYSLVSLKSLPF